MRSASCRATRPSRQSFGARAGPGVRLVPHVRDLEGPRDEAQRPGQLHDGAEDRQAAVHGGGGQAPAPTKARKSSRSWRYARKV
jgi:hypothetical protein